MSATTATLAQGRAQPAPLRAALFVGALALIWITLQPFADLGAADALDLGSGREVLTYCAFAACAGLCLALGAEEKPALRLLAAPPFVGLAIWIGLSCVFSQDVATSLKRAALGAFVAIVAASLPLLPAGRRHFARLLAVAAGALILLSYLGVMLAPRFAIHQASDLGEPALAGDWRGVFGHKNTASVIFVFVAFIGIYVARVENALVGGALAAFALLFVVFANGKTANLVWAPAFAAGLAAPRFGAGWTWRAAALAPFAALSALGLGAVLFAPLGALVAALPIDASFTGRTDIWRYALGKLAQRPLLGFGYDAFWNTESVRYGTDNAAAWVASAAHAHNCWVDIAMSIGVPGVALAFWAFVVQPLRDIGRAARAGADPALLSLFTQIWLMGVTMTALESFWFDRADPIWCTFLVAVFGLRYVARFRSAP